ncbi:MAG: hypothetical protein FWC41_07975, partial [Firmicutes bacterium]|nr:hypothetical protein [Bacillota bacterium]
MNANKQIISNILLLTSIAIYNIKSELDELKTESSHSFYIIKSLESDLSILKSIHTILQSHIANSLENKLKDVVWSDFLCIDGDFTLDTFDRPLSENE